MNNLIETYNNIVHKPADPRVENLFLMGSPFPIIFIVIGYLYFVFKLGPRFMKNRPAYNIDKLMVVYNLVQITICASLVAVVTFKYLYTFNFVCSPVDYSNDPDAVLMTKLGYVYFLLKIADLLDTVFFVLRNKNNQISFLHVYHHTGMCFLTWIGVKYISGGHSAFIPYINSIVHTIMYTYYLLTAWDKSYKNSIWWKKHITQLQIAQFVILFVLYGQLLFQPNCGYPRWTAFYFLPQNIFMIILFSNFYIKTYVKPQQKKKQLVDINGNNNLNKHKTKSH